MITLSIETSTIFGGIAIIDDNTGIIAESRLNVKTTYSERLMPEIDHIIKTSHINIKDIDFFSVSIGPGSFTGLRIGLSTAKGFAFSTGKPIVAVPTLEAFAWNFPYCKHPICIMLDAKKKEVYTAIFIWEFQECKKILGEISIKIIDLIDKISKNSFNKQYNNKSKKDKYNKIIFAGDGAILYKDTITSKLGDIALFPPMDKMVPSPANVGILGLKKAKRGEFSDSIKLTPFYIRKSEAEIRYQNKFL